MSATTLLKHSVAEYLETVKITTKKNTHLCVFF